MPSTPTTPAQLAGQAHEAIAELCRRTIWDDDSSGYEWPSDVDSVASNLSQAAHAMAQAIEQAGRWLAKQAQVGRIGFDADGRDLDLPQGIALLNSAAYQARVLGEALDGAARHTSHLTGLDADTGGAELADADDDEQGAGPLAVGDVVRIVECCCDDVGERGRGHEGQTGPVDGFDDPIVFVRLAGLAVCAAGIVEPADIPSGTQQTRTPGGDR